jgi:hypothetical protein
MCDTMVSRQAKATSAHQAYSWSATVITVLSFKRHMYEADQQCKGRAPRGILYASDAQMNVRGTPEAHSNDLECPVAVKIPLNTYFF